MLPAEPARSAQKSAPRHSTTAIDTRVSSYHARKPGGHHKETMFFKKIATVAALICATSMMTGCAVNRSSANLAPGTDLAAIKTAYVVKHDKDDRKINEIIKTKLESKGYLVTTGPELPTPYTTDMSVTYVDKWMWDITMYMLELTVNFRDPKSNFPIATGNSFHTSLTRKSPDEMVEEVINNIQTAPKK